LALVGSHVKVSANVEFTVVTQQDNMADDALSPEADLVVKNQPIKLSAAADLLFATDSEKEIYWDRAHFDSTEAQMIALSKSSTVYVGNLAFSTRSHNILSHFSQIGPVRKIYMGLDRHRKTPCGFCFCEFYYRKDALQAIAHLTETKLDGRVIRVELDAGYYQGREYGRGKSGGQVRDERRNRQMPSRSTNRYRPNQTASHRMDSGSSNYYGPSAGEKREREDYDYDTGHNKRFREN
jgi:nuclear cap-binding protein subunit 2